MCPSGPCKPTAFDSLAGSHYKSKREVHSMNGDTIISNIAQSHYYARLDYSTVWHTLKVVEWPCECACGLIVGLLGLPGDTPPQMAYGRACPGELCAECARRTKEGVAQQARMDLTA